MVYLAVGVAALSFGFGTAGSSFAAGVVATAFAFGLVLLALAYVLGPISGCHINPAVTIGAWLAGRIPLKEAAGYWVAQFVGGILGALLLWGTFNCSPLYSTSKTGLGTDPPSLSVGPPSTRYGCSSSHRSLAARWPRVCAGMTYGLHGVMARQGHTG